MGRYYCANCNTGNLTEPRCPICYRPTRQKRRRRSEKRKLPPSPGQRRIEKIAAQEGWTCHICLGPLCRDGQGDEQPTLDHLIPASKGGTDALWNLRLAHHGCNQARGNNDLVICVRVEAGNFVGAVNIYGGVVVSAAPILSYMVGWTARAVFAYTEKKGWRASTLRGEYVRASADAGVAAQGVVADSASDAA